MAVLAEVLFPIEAVGWDILVAGTQLKIGPRDATQTIGQEVCIGSGDLVPAPGQRCPQWRLVHSAGEMSHHLGDMHSAVQEVSLAGRLVPSSGQVFSAGATCILARGLLGGGDLVHSAGKSSAGRPVHSAGGMSHHLGNLHSAVQEIKDPKIQSEVIGSGKMPSLSEELPLGVP
ncbi:hypothetical protein O6P43_023669 [Quillaja saponaria]|uniref:Uncharacterized protein n=1 Tax=Quillaja saponaria TaxID=32244 RepID=A0AAD7LG37_QUISA|nr:hypothetical protein O6P43_023669 [Quillaja saponaria]